MTGAGVILVFYGLGALWTAEFARSKIDGDTLPYVHWISREIAAALYAMAILFGWWLIWLIAMRRAWMEMNGQTGPRR